MTSCMGWMMDGQGAQVAVGPFTIKSGPLEQRALSCVSAAVAPACLYIQTTTHQMRTRPQQS